MKIFEQWLIEFNDKIKKHHYFFQTINEGIIETYNELLLKVIVQTFIRIISE